MSLSENECWEWQRRVNIGGYGMFDLREHAVAAHRVSYFMFNKVDPENLCVCHKCDNPKCVRPSHLFLGTDKDNVHDMHKKGRFSKRSGEANNHSVLKESQVIEIKNRYNSEDISVRQLADFYGVSTGAIHLVISNTNWKGVGGFCVNKNIVNGNKLTSKKVLKIREDYYDKVYSVEELAELYKVTTTTIYHITSYSTWKNVLAYT